MARGVCVVVELLLGDDGVIEQRVPALLDLPQGETTAEFHSQMNRGQICRLTEHTHTIHTGSCALPHHTSIERLYGYIINTLKIQGQCLHSILRYQIPMVYSTDASVIYQ